MPKVEAPFTNTTVDTSRPGTSLRNIVLGVLGVALTLAMFAGGQSVYNKLAENTPDSVQPVEVL